MHQTPSVKNSQEQGKGQILELNTAQVRNKAMIPRLCQDHPLCRQPAFPLAVLAESEQDPHVPPGGMGGSSPAHGPGTSIFSLFPFLNATEEKSGALWSMLSGGRPRGVPPKARSADGWHSRELQLLCKSREDVGSLFAAGLTWGGTLAADRSISQTPPLPLTQHLGCHHAPPPPWDVFLCHPCPHLRSW